MTDSGKPKYKCGGWLSGSGPVPMRGDVSEEVSYL
jgi:hypothetical protein